jgi:hypothetical protein
MWTDIPNEDFGCSRRGVMKIQAGADFAAGANADVRAHEHVP